MKVTSFILILSVLLTSCSSMKKTIIYSSLIGGVAGTTTGVMLSPNKESRGANGVIFGLLGAGITALAGYALYKDDPRNYPLQNMLMDEPKASLNDSDPNIELGMGAFKIDANLNKEVTYAVPLKDLPEELKGKVNQQFLIKYQSKERYVKKGNKTYFVPAFDIYEHAYSESPESVQGEVNEK